MRSLVILLICSTSLLCQAGSSYFPGLVYLNCRNYSSSGPAGDLSKQVSNTYEFKFYTNPEDSVEAHILSIYFDWAHIPRKEKIWEDDYATWFSPMCLDTSAVYDIYLTCKSRKGDWFEVIVNEKTKETLWIKNAVFISLIPWHKLNTRKRWSSISTHEPIYQRPDTASPEITVTSNCFRIEKVTGNWIRISSNDAELCGSSDQPSISNAWVRFRTPDELLITVTFY